MRVPFKIPTVNEAHEAEGFLYIEDDLFVVEYVILKLGMFRQDTHFVKVGRSAIRHIEAQRRFFFDRLIIETESIDFLRAVPGNHATSIVLRTKKRDRDAAAQFVDRVFDWLDRPAPRSSNDYITP